MIFHKLACSQASLLTFKNAKNIGHFHEYLIKSFALRAFPTEKWHIGVLLGVAQLFCSAILIVVPNSMH